MLPAQAGGHKALLGVCGVDQVWLPGRAAGQVPKRGGGGRGERHREKGTDGRTLGPEASARTGTDERTAGEGFLRKCLEKDTVCLFGFLVAP